MAANVITNHPVLAIRRTHSLLFSVDRFIGGKQSVLLVGARAIGKPYAEGLRLVAREGETNRIDGLDQPISLKVMRTQEKTIKMRVATGPWATAAISSVDLTAGAAADINNVFIEFAGLTSDTHEATRPIPIIKISAVVSGNEQAAVCIPVIEFAPYFIEFNAPGFDRPSMINVHGVNAFDGARFVSFEYYPPSFFIDGAGHQFTSLYPDSRVFINSAGYEDDPENGIIVSWAGVYTISTLTSLKLQFSGSLFEQFGPEVFDLSI